MKKHLLLALVACVISNLSLTAQISDDEKDPRWRDLSNAAYQVAKSKQQIKEMPEPKKFQEIPIPEEIPGIKRDMATRPANASQLRAASNTMLLDSVVYCHSSNEIYAKDVYAYDEKGQNISFTHYGLTDGVLEMEYRYEYVYDDAGNMITEKTYWETLYGETIYTYDDSGILRSRLFTAYHIPENTIDYQWIYEYNAYGYQTLLEYKKFDNNGDLSSNYKYIYEYDDSGRRTLYEYWVLDGDELRVDYRYVYEYNNYGDQTVYEYYSWDGSQLQLRDAIYSAWDDNRNQTYYESRVWNGSLMELFKYNCNYDSLGRMTYYECVNNDETWYYHILQTYDFIGTDASSYVYVDSTYYKDDNYWSISAYAGDLTYDNNGNILVEEEYAYDTSTETRGAITNKYTYEYDAQGNRILSIISTYYSNGLPSYSYKYEYEYGENGSYEYLRYMQYANEDEWTLFSGYKYEYTQINEHSYSYINYDWDIDTNEWVAYYGYKYEYTNDDTYGTNYEQVYYELDTTSNDWNVTSGYKYINEYYDDGGYYIYSADWDISTNAWVTNYGSKDEVTGINPEVHTQYLLNNDDDWALSSITYYYYSEAAATGNESISQQATLKVYPLSGGFRIESTQAGTLSVYGISGGMVYNAQTNGNTTVSNLTRGIYIVKLQTTSGTDIIKVQVK